MQPRRCLSAELVCLLRQGHRWLSSQARALPRPLAASTPRLVSEFDHSWGLLTSVESHTVLALCVLLISLSRVTPALWWPVSEPPPFSS